MNDFDSLLDQYLNTPDWGRPQTEEDEDEVNQL